MDETQTDQIICRILAVIGWITPLVPLKLPPIGAEDFDLIPRLGKLPVGMRDFPPPEADWPAGLFGNRRVRHNNCDSLCVVRVKHIDLYTHASPSGSIQK